MTKLRQRKGSPETFIPKALTGDQVKELVEKVTRDLREAAAERRRLGIPDPEAPGLTPEARESRCGRGPEAEFLPLSTDKTLIMNVGKERGF